MGDIGDDQVRITASLVIPLSITVDQDVYEQWLEGFEEAGTTVADSFSIELAEALETTSGADIEIQEAWLVDDTGDKIARLKRF